MKQKQTSVAVRALVDDESSLLLSRAPLFGSSLLGLLCYIRRTCAAPLRLLSFVLLSIFLFVLFGFLL